MKRQLLPKIATNNVRHIPLGYTDKMAVHRDGRAVPIVDRKYRWSFCGDPSRSDRKEMIENMSQVGEGFVHEYHGFMAGHYGRKSARVLGRVITNIPEDIALLSSAGAWDSVVDLRNWIA